MATIRILYTLEDVKKLLARIHNVPIDQINVFDSEKLHVETSLGTFEIEDETYLF